MPHRPSCSSNVELTREQLDQIEANRLKALQRCQELSELQRLSTSALGGKNTAGPAVDDTRCASQLKAHEAASQVAQQLCEVCKEGPADSAFLEAFDELVCKNCKLKSDDYELINKADISAQYLLTDSTIRLMKFLGKDNPRNAHWAQMKLYLRKQAKQKSIARWGSEDELENQRNRRKTERFEKEFNKSDDFLGGSSEVEPDETSSTLSKLIANMKGEEAEEDAKKQNTNEDEGRLAKKKKGADKQSAASQPNLKRAKAVSKMASIIKGIGY